MDRDQDPPTAECLFRRLPELVSMLIRRGYDPDLAEDASQNAIVRGILAIQSGRAFTFPNRRAWLQRVAINEAKALSRAKEIRLGNTEIPSAESDPLSSIECRVLLEAITRLPKEIQQIVECIFMRKMSKRASSNELGIHPRTLLLRIQDALELLRHEMIESGI